MPMRRMSFALVLAVAVAACVVAGVAAQQPASGPQYTSDGKLVKPADYRQWVFLSSGLGMTYGPAASTNRAPMFDNVFVNPEAYRAFTKTGKWPDKTIFILEVRRAEENVSINNGGRTQGAIAAIESAVKDESRFKATNGWAYFDLGANASAPPLASSASCYACHKNNTAVEQTFVQFYPELMDVARRMGTVRADYDPARKP